MKPFETLELGYTDAENYRRKENKDLFNKVFIRNHYLDDLCRPAVSFLIGEKGAGKTAYAVYLANNHYKNVYASLRYIRETDYRKFIALKNDKHLTLSDYSNIWRVIAYLLLSRQLIEREGGPAFFQRFTQINALKNAVEEYYSGAFAPELTQALQLIEESDIAAGLMAEHLKASAESKVTSTFSSTRFQTSLFYIQRSFENAFEQLRLESDHVLFIDGIDTRPSSIPFAEYMECIKGLANAVWEINNDVFPRLKSKGRLRAVLLIRPDIFASVGLQNLNTKSRDNSVFLDWRTDYQNYRNSGLFRVVDHLMSSQQGDESSDGKAWDQYFPWNAPDVEGQHQGITSFLSFLRYSYYRPRDIITMLKILQDKCKEDGFHGNRLGESRFDSPAFKREYADYLLGEIREHLTFYYSTEEYEMFLKFFTFLKGKGKFDYSTFTYTFDKFSKTVIVDDIETPRFMLNANIFLQFLYDLNIICFMETTESDREYIRWCFRERSYGNISPKVKEGATYRVFIGLYKALNLGQLIT